LQKHYFAVLFIIFFTHLTVASTFYGCDIAANSCSASNYRVAGLDSDEQQVVALVNGTKVYGYDLELERIASSSLVYRSAGSQAANEAANWIKQTYESFGLQGSLESFQFTNWTLLSKPSLVIDLDGNRSTMDDQTAIPSFQSEHYSWPTPEDGVFADLVILPLPEAANWGQLGLNPIGTSWDSINTTGKIVLIGREVRWNSDWRQSYSDKLLADPPVGVIYTWWYDWMNFTPPMHSSAEGLPLGGHYYWDLQIPVGFVSYGDGLWIQQREATNVSAQLTIESVIGTGTHYNVVGKIAGHDDPQKFIIVSSHYDTPMCNGFADNGAGTAGIVELARVFAEAITMGLYSPRYTLLFVAFTGEEIMMVGSGHYVKQHKSDMQNIVEVVNLDGIGNKFLNVSQTSPGSEFDLDEVVVKAAQDLGIGYTNMPSGGGDEASFSSPSTINDMIYRNWAVDLGISDATPVNSSVMIYSNPEVYSHKWNMGTPGWVHTSYDNSTSTQTFGWVTEDNLEDHVKVAALSIMRISAGTITGTDFTPIVIGVAVTVVFVASISAFLVVRMRRSKK